MTAYEIARHRYEYLRNRPKEAQAWPGSRVVVPGLAQHVTQRGNRRERGWSSVEKTETEEVRLAAVLGHRSVPYCFCRTSLGRHRYTLFSMLTKLAPWLSSIVASIALIFAVRSYNTAQDNLRIQQQTARPLTTIARQGFFVQGDPPVYSYKLSYRNIGNQAADLVQVAVIALNHVSGKSNDIMMDFKANPLLNGEDKNIEKNGVDVDKLFDFFVVCFRYQSPGGNPFAEEYYFRMPNNYRKGGGTPIEISHDDYDQLARHHVCQEQRYWFTPL